MTARNRWRAGLLCVAAVGVAIGLGACGGSDDDGPAETVDTTAVAPADASGGTGAADAATDATAAGDPQDGESVFADNCAGCHGPEGKGGGVGPDLSRSADAGDVVKVIAQVTNGGGGMPAFGDQLDETQIRDVSAYVTEVVHGGG